MVATAQLVQNLTDDECLALLYDWRLDARPEQTEPPGDWLGWLILAGRGFGKTRTGAEWIRENVESGKAGRVALVGEDAGDVRDVMIEGESGILSKSPPWFKPKYTPSKKKVEWPNGAKALVFADKDPETLRGPQHDLAWIDELAKFPNQDVTWDNLMFGLRLGSHPRVCITTTPRPTKLIKSMRKDPSFVHTFGSTYHNMGNLSSAYKNIVKRYEGTRLGRQELHAEILEDTPGALWTLSVIEETRDLTASIEHMDRVVVAIDPSVSSGESAAEAGIVICASKVIGGVRHGFVFGDRSTQGSPSAWAGVAIRAYNEFSADRIIAETNNGGEMVEAVLRNVDSSVSYSAVHASRGKSTRAEPISALYERGLIHHVGVFTELEDQMTTWVPGEKSPDRMDALVWGLTELFETAVVDLSMAAFGVELVAHRGYLE